LAICWQPSTSRYRRITPLAVSTQARFEDFFKSGLTFKTEFEHGREHLGGHQTEAVVTEEPAGSSWRMVQFSPCKSASSFRRCAFSLFTEKGI
jgi:hypothetical protein